MEVKTLPSSKMSSDKNEETLPSSASANKPAGSTTAVVGPPAHFCLDADGNGFSMWGGGKPLYHSFFAGTTQQRPPSPVRGGEGAGAQAHGGNAGPIKDGEGCSGSSVDGARFKIWDNLTTPATYRFRGAPAKRDIQWYYPPVAAPSPVGGSGGGAAGHVGGTKEVSPGTDTGKTSPSKEGEGGSGSSSPSTPLPRQLSYDFADCPVPPANAPSARSYAGATKHRSSATIKTPATSPQHRRQEPPSVHRGPQHPPSLHHYNPVSRASEYDGTGLHTYVRDSGKWREEPVRQQRKWNFRGYCCLC